MCYSLLLVGYLSLIYQTRSFLLTPAVATEKITQDTTAWAELCQAQVSKPDYSFLQARLFCQQARLFSLQARLLCRQEHNLVTAVTK